MRTGWAVSIVAALGLTLTVIGPVSASPSSNVAEDPASTPPNVLIILTDDQRAGTEVGMPTVMSEIAAKGTSYSEAFVPTSWCCPSRASLLTGKFAHNTGVWQNAASSAWGAWTAFAYGGEEQDTLATRLQAAGYRTGLFGKYLNSAELAGKRSIPPGWDAWTAFIGGNHTNYRLTSDVTPTLAKRRYLTDELADQAVKFIESVPADEPVFTYFAPYAPHFPFDAGPYVGSTRAAGLLDDVMLATKFPSPSTNQADMSGYPRWMQQIPTSDTWNVEKRRSRDALTLPEVVERQSDMLMGVDFAIRRMIEALREAGRLENTLIVFMSDNGFAWGEHRLQGKNTAYDVSVRVPLIMRFDGTLRAGITDPRVVAANVDVHATIMDITGVQPGAIDGLSVLTSNRDGLVMEAMKWRNGFKRPAYCGYRSRNYLFVRYATGEEELYDYSRDPYELKNVAADPVYGAVRNSLLSQSRRACSPTPPGFSWDEASPPLGAPRNIQTKRVGRTGVVVSWRAPDNVGAQFPRYEVYVGSTRGTPACTLTSSGLFEGLRCRVNLPPRRTRMIVTVVAVRGDERASAMRTVLKRPTAATP